jgi:hypothetical protein
MGKVPDSLRDQLGIVIAMRSHKAYRTLLYEPRWQRALTPGNGPKACSGPAREPRIRPF